MDILNQIKDGITVTHVIEYDFQSALLLILASVAIAVVTALITKSLVG